MNAMLAGNTHTHKHTENLITVIFAQPSRLGLKRYESRQDLMECLFNIREHTYKNCMYINYYTYKHLQLLTKLT